MTGKELKNVIGGSGHEGLEVYVRAADGTHVPVTGVDIVRYNDNGPFVIELTKG